MTEEFNLSDKIMFQMGDEMLDKDNQVVHVEDVKEFIKRLKEEIKNLDYDTDLIFKTEVYEKIEELAGDRLR